MAVEKDEKILRPKNNFGDSFGGSNTFGNPFEQMRNLMDRFFKQGFDKSFFRDRMGGMKAFSFGSGEGLKIDHSENKQYKLVTIKAAGLKKDSMNIKIKGGIVSISGEIRRTHTEGGGQSIFINSFSESFGVPQGVDAAKVEFENIDNKIILKFPKV